MDEKDITVINAGEITYLKYDEIKKQAKDGIILYLWNGYIVLCIQE